MFDAFTHSEHGRVIINSLSGKDFPIIEAGGIRFQMPLTYDSGLIASRLEQLGHGGLRSVKAAVFVIIESIRVAVFAREDASAARAANGIRHQAAVEAHALFGQTINVGSLDEFARVVIRADSLVGMVIGKDENDVGTRGGGKRGRGSEV